MVDSSDMGEDQEGLDLDEQQPVTNEKPGKRLIDAVWAMGWDAAKSRRTGFGNMMEARTVNLEWARKTIKADVMRMLKDVGATDNTESEIRIRLNNWLDLEG